MKLEYVKGVPVPKMSLVSNVDHHVKDPVRYPKVQGGYEGLAQNIFGFQMTAMMVDLTKKMVEIKKTGK